MKKFIYLLFFVTMYVQAEALETKDGLDFQKSLSLAQAGNAKAQLYVGYLYSQGKGVPKNKEQSFFWYQKAALQGIVKAQSIVAYKYDISEGVKEDRVKAIEWYRKAAYQGDDTSMHTLGEFYCHPKQGVPVQLEVCYALLSLSASKDKSGLSETVFNLRSKDMANSQIEAGKELAKEMAKPNNLLIALDDYVKTHPTPAK